MSRMKHAFVGVSIALFITNIAIASHWKENAKAVDISGEKTIRLFSHRTSGPGLADPTVGISLESVILRHHRRRSLEFTEEL